MRQVYFDHHSSTPLHPEARRASEPFLHEHFGGPGALHRHGLRARQALEEARERVARLLNADSPETILFTGSATESANLAIKGTAWTARHRGQHILTTRIEHPAILGSVDFLERHGFRSTRLGVGRDGRIDPESVRQAIEDGTILIAIHWAHPDIGTIQPVEAIAEIAADRGVTLFVDASAAGGWLPIDVRHCPVGLLSLAPHRFYGPKGVGVLYRHRRARLEPLIHGGVQEGGLRAGTENVAGIVAAGVAAEIAGRELMEIRPRIEELQGMLWNGVRERVREVYLNGPEPGPKRLFTHLNFSTRGVEGEGLALALDMQGVAVNSGTSCVSKAYRISPAFEAIGADFELALSSLMLTLGRENCREDADYFLDLFPKVVERLRAMSPGWNSRQPPRRDEDFC